jgi:hypothetical protein
VSPQRVSLDRFRTAVYIAASAVAASCVPKLAPLVSVALLPADRADALAWVRQGEPRRDTAIRFRFRYNDQRHSWAGRGTARLAPPDSLRFDYTGPLGLGSGAAVVVGDSTRWAEPEENFHSLVPAIRLLWAALGVVRPPDSSAVIAAAQQPPRSIWRFVTGSDTLDYVATSGPTRTLEAEWRRAGTVEARSRTDLDARGEPVEARVDFPEASAHFEISVVGVDTTATFAGTLWERRR